jgi:hypothetical protein
MKDKFNWTNQQLDDVWWKVHHRLMEKLPSNDLLRIQKFNYNHLPMNNKIHKCYGDHKEHCENCPTEIETEKHILRCGSEQRNRIQEEWLSELNKFLSEDHTSDDIKTCIITSVTIWLNNDRPLHHNNFPATVRDTYRQQTALGWDHFARGRLTMSWGAANQQSYQTK